MSRTFEFGPFRIDTEERLLRRGDEVVALTPKAIDTLLVLAESAGRAVDKDELLRRVWPDTFVEEGGLARNVSLLRKVLGDEYIDTIPRRGYRFTATVRENSAGRSLAVLPLENLGGEDYFAEGMTDELIAHLMRIESLRVASRTSAMRYRGAGKPLAEIAHELRVQWIVEGTVLHAGGRVRINVRLMEGAAESRLWSETYERDVRDVLTLQSEVARDIARAIRGKLIAPQARAVTPEAYQEYLRGRYFLNKRTTADLKRARDYFRRAIDRDPTYAPAHSGLADSYAMMASSGYDMLPPREAMPLARSAARNALAIDDTLADAHATLGYVALVFDWNGEAAHRHLDRAIELNANCAAAHQWRGELLLARGHAQPAIDSFRRALEIDPLSIPCNLGLGWSYYFSKNYEAAIEQYRRTLEIAPSVPMALYGIGLSYHHQNRLHEGLLEIQKAHMSSGGDAAAIMLLGVAKALAGERTQAEALLARLAELAEQRYVPAVYFAFIHSTLNNLDAAFEWLEQAAEERSTFLIFLSIQPAMERLRADPRYGRLVRAIGNSNHIGLTPA